MLVDIHASKKPTFIAYNIPAFGAIGDFLIRNYQGHMNFESLGPKRTRLTWTGYFDCVGPDKITEPLMRMVMKN